RSPSRASPRTPRYVARAAPRRPRAGPPCRGSRSGPTSEEPAALGRADVLAPESRDHAPARCALDEPELQKVGLVHVLDRVGLLAQRDGERREPYGATA